MAFDKDYNYTHTYDETDSNNIGYFIKNTYEPKVIVALPGTTNVTIPTYNQIYNVDNSNSISSAWLLTTNYWTQNSNPTLDGLVWLVDGKDACLSGNDGIISEYYGARPVITTPKSNLIAE